MNTATPLAVDIYSRFMVSGYNERDIIGVPTGFQAFFGAPETGAKTLFSPDSAVVEIDILRGNEKLAAMVQRGTIGRPLNKQQNTNDQKFTSQSRKYPLIEEEGDVNSNQLILRQAGENPYASRTRLDRMRELAMGHHKEHLRRIVRTNEYLASYSILNGQQPALIGTSNSDLIYDFHRNSTHNVTVGAAWNGASVDIFGDIDSGCDLVRQDGHVTPDMFIVGDDAMGALINDDIVQAQADNRRFELIEVSTNNPVPARFDRFVKAGFTPRGRIRTPKGYELWMFTYVDTYENSAGSATKYMTADKAIIAFSGSRFDRYFGPADVLPMSQARAAWYREMFGFSPAAPPMPDNIKNIGHALPNAAIYCDAYVGSNQKTVTIRTQCAPIFATTMTDSLVVLDGLIT